MKRPRIELAAVLTALIVLSAAATWYVSQSGWTLYYGDAEAHLNIARRVLDSRTPGYNQIGTPWLPLPVALTMLFVQYDPWWRNGLAGAIPSSACFVLACAFLFATVRRVTGSSAAAFASAGILALNPNLLYLQATPMTEPIFLAAFMALLYFTILFRDTQSMWSAAGAGFASCAASLSRYEGWVLIPFVALYFLFAARRQKLRVAIVFGAIASLAPIYWILHNWWMYWNPLEFFDGPYSAKGIYQRALAQHMPASPGDHDWKKSWQFFRTTARVCVGWGAVLIGAVGFLGSIWKRALWPLFLTAIPPVFYIWRMHAGESPIFMPGLWFSSYYNTRYALSVLPMLAIAGAGVVFFAPIRWRPLVAAGAIAVAITPWLIYHQPDDWVCWKESEVNSIQRRAWMHQAAQLLSAEYHPGTGIYTSLGDDGIGILREAGIPLRDALRDANGLTWMIATERPELFLHEQWALAVPGDPVARAVGKGRYHRVLTIAKPYEPVIQVYKRD